MEMFSFFKRKKDKTKEDKSIDRFVQFHDLCFKQPFKT